MGESTQRQEEVDRQLRGLQAIEHIREALEDRFEVEVRETVAGGADYPVDRLHDYLTGVHDGHEPRVRLLFELFGRGALDTTGLLADAPASCFFLGTSVRHQRSLDDWLALFAALGSHPDGEAYARQVDDADELELWSAGDLVWGRSRERAQDAADYLTLLLDAPVGLWHARIRPERLRVLAQDRWSGREEARYVVSPRVLDVADAERVRHGQLVRRDVPLASRPRVVDEL